MSFQGCLQIVNLKIYEKINANDSIVYFFNRSNKELAQHYQMITLFGFIDKGKDLNKRDNILKLEESVEDTFPKKKDKSKF